VGVGLGGICSSNGDVSYPCCSSFPKLWRDQQRIRSLLPTFPNSHVPFSGLFKPLRLGWPLPNHVCNCTARSDFSLQWHPLRPHTQRSNGMALVWHWGTWLVGMVVVGWWLDWMILEVFPNRNDCLILWGAKHKLQQYRNAATSICGYGKQTEHCRAKWKSAWKKTIQNTHKKMELPFKM